MHFSISGVLSSRETDIGQRALARGSISVEVLIWKKAYINLFITYFNNELKRIKLTSHTDTKLMDMSDRYRLRDSSPDMETPTNLSSLDTDLFQTTIDSWAEVTSWGLISCYQCFAPISAHEMISLWHFRYLRMGKIDVITYKYVINIDKDGIYPCIFIWQQYNDTV